ncbi:MAG: ATP-binding cassette domain-containing protein [Clostridium sp.]|nr:ATP-binding cassette domain-containing protein [Clostridium sp.]
MLEAESGVLSFHAASSIGYMLQHDHLFEWRTIYQNVILGLELNKTMTKENTDYVFHLLKEYGLYSFKDKKPSELSGGMRQRAALIRTMAVKPDILLLDEPFSALDFQTRMTVSADIGNIIRNTKKTAILITHDLSEAITLADRVIVLSGRPASVKYELPIHFDIARTSALSIRSTDAYQTYFNLLWKELSDDSSDKETIT